MFPPTRPVRPAAMKTGRGDLQKATPPEIQGHPIHLRRTAKGAVPPSEPPAGGWCMPYAPPRSGKSEVWNDTLEGNDRTLKRPWM